MTIASAFNEIAVANGGQADTSGTIAGAVDALTDALAGSDIAQGATIEDGVRVLGEYISGGGGGFSTDSAMISVSVNKTESAIDAILLQNNAPVFSCISSHLVAPCGADIVFGSEDFLNNIACAYKIGGGSEVSLPIEFFNQFDMYGARFTVPTDLPAGASIKINFTTGI